MPPNPESPNLQSILLGIIEVRPLTTVLRSLAQAALELIGADYAALGAYNEELHLDSFEVHGISPVEQAAVGHPPHGIGLLGQFALLPATINAARTEDHEAFTGFPPGHPPMGAFLGVPVVYAGRTVGAFYITRRPGNPPFTTEDEQRLEALAPYAAIAITNARIFEQQQGRTRTAEMLANTARGLQSAVDEHAAAWLLVQGIREALPDAGRIGVCWMRPDGVGSELLHGDRDGALRRLFGEQPVIELQRGEHEQEDWLPGEAVTLQVTDFSDGGRLVLGVSTSQPLESSDEGRVALRALQELGVVGFTALRQREAQRSLERYTVHDAIARDLHDDIIQTVYSAGLELHAARSLESVSKSEALDHASRELNGIITELRSYIQYLTANPSDVESGQMLRTRLTTLLAQGIGPTHWQSRIELDSNTLPPGFERQLYLVSRELISNVERHAKALEASLSLVGEEGEIQLDVVDDGCGFDRTQVRDNAVGLRSLEQRVADLGGSALVESSPGSGTRITVRVPLPSLATTERQRMLGIGFADDEHYIP